MMVSVSVVCSWIQSKRSMPHISSYGHPKRLSSLTVHIILTLFLIELALLLRGRILVLLVLRHEIVHITFGLRKFHLVHPLSGVPVQECLAAEHRCEELSHTLDGDLRLEGGAGAPLVVASVRPGGIAA